MKYELYGSCEECKYADRAAHDDPCRICKHAAIDYFEKAKTIKIADLIEILMKEPNQEKGIPLTMEVERLIK